MQNESNRALCDEKPSLKIGIIPAYCDLIFGPLT